MKCPYCDEDISGEAQVYPICGETLHSQEGHLYGRGVNQFLEGNGYIDSIRDAMRNYISNHISGQSFHGIFVTKVMKELINVAIELTNLLDKAANTALPQEIVDVVKLHSKLAVGSAWIPVPGADIAAGATNIWSMYVRINNKIGIPVKENVLKSIGAGVATNLTSYIAMSGVASAMKFIPGIGSVGGALIMSASLYAVTLVSGWVYLKALCIMTQRNGNSINSGDFKQAIDQVLSDKALIKRLINTAKKDYQK